MASRGSDAVNIKADISYSKKSAVILVMKQIEKTLLILFLFCLLTGSCIDFFDTAEGTGTWLGQFAFTWALLLVIFTGFCSTLFIILTRTILLNVSRARAINRLIVYRSKLGWARWLLVIFFLALPLWFFQMTAWGIIFQGIWLRISFWTISLFFLSVLLTDGDEIVIGWNVFLFSLLITASCFSIFASLRFVTNYPFSLGWSEGNRLWDYSILFGRGRYNYPETSPIPVLLDIGRQLVGGLPFLIPDLSIKTERLWIGLVSIFPYILLGMVSFRSLIRERLLWVSFSLWTYLFLSQGPIYSPLILCAILVGLAWKAKMWYSILLVLIASYVAYISRYTWTFAPLMWFFILEYLDESVAHQYKFDLTPRVKQLFVAFIFSILGGFLIYFMVMYVQSNEVANVWGLITSSSISPGRIQTKITQQPLLWYRLLPNETYSLGVLAGLFIATAPLVIILLYLLVSKKYRISNLQAWMAVPPLLAFLAVGLVVSSKIGGGGDLHNLDMYLIGLLFAGVSAVHSGALEWVRNSELESASVKIVIVLLIAIPAIGPLQSMRTYQYSGSVAWLVALTNAPSERSLDIYPSQEEINKSVAAIQHKADLEKATGEILFMDQRQLLTFGFVQGIPLVPDYDKKALMENALIKNAHYFHDFYNDLEKKRFSLIVIQPLNITKKGSDYQFGEENDAWVRWVAKPLLCYYEINQTLISVNVQLLVPRTGTMDCAKDLPLQETR